MIVNCENELCTYNKFCECNRDEVSIDDDGNCTDAIYSYEDEEYDEGNIVELQHEKEEKKYENERQVDSD